MRPTQAILRPFTRRVLPVAGIRYLSVNIKPPAIQNGSTLDLKDHVYFSKATAGGAGRNGFVRSWGDSPLELKMSMPRNAGGKGDGQNPEQLFAMGYASCFLGALQLTAARANKKELAENATVTAHVFLGHPKEPDLEGFALRVELCVEGCPDDTIIAEAHEFCPYSRALRESTEVTITKG
ncbi:OsmC-domain-containing protein [Ganoderma leucocontextum]|nr:OsmC-domain-containing protein [Ganoderma leucocontextum]